MFALPTLATQSTPSRRIAISSIPCQMSRDMEAAKENLDRCAHELEEILAGSESVPVADVNQVQINYNCTNNKIKE